MLLLLNLRLLLCQRWIKRIIKVTSMISEFFEFCVFNFRWFVKSNDLKAIFYAVKLLVHKKASEKCNQSNGIDPLWNVDSGEKKMNHNYRH